MSDWQDAPPAKIDALDPSLRDAINGVTAAMQDASAAAQAAASSARDATNAVRTVQAALTGLQAATEKNTIDVATIAAGLKDAMTRTERIERHAFGSEPPSASIPATPLDELAARADTAASRATLEVAALEGRVIAGFAQAEAKQSEIAAELAKQSSAMGIGKRGLAWLVSREGISTAIKLATLAGVAWGTFYLAAQRSEGHAPPAPIYVLPAPVQSSPVLPPSTLDAGTR